MTENEIVATLEAWVLEDRDLADKARASSATAHDQAETIRWFSGAPDAPEAEKSRMLAQAEQLEAVGRADEAEATAWDAAADGWQTILDAIHSQAPGD